MNKLAANQLVVKILVG